MCVFALVSEKITSNVHQGVGGRGQADLSSNSTSTIHSLSDLCKLISWRLSFLIYELVIMNSLSKYLISTSTVKDTGNREVNMKVTFLVVTQL